MIESYANSLNPDLAGNLPTNSDAKPPSIDSVRHLLAARFAILC
jgi:hypothetical protein